MEEKIGLIGVGNMGGAIVEGLFREKIVKPSHVWVYDKFTEKSQEFAGSWMVHSAKSSEELIRHTDVVILAIKPQDLDSVAAEIRGAFHSGQVVVSILAGVPIERLRKVFGPGVELVRAMPNLGAKAGESMTALTATSDRAFSFAEQIFSGCGKIIRLSEGYFDLVTAISGSGPAYFFLLMELLAKEGMAHGLTAHEANLLAVQTAVGSALLAAAEDVSPAELRKRVTSKGGTTEAALKIFEASNLPGIVAKAVQAALDRGKELGKGQ